MNVTARKISPTSKVWYVAGLGIRGSRGDIRRWAGICGHTVTWVAS